ncbi:WD40/YVTN/BNR-like repeat-containing protein [Ideonella margarita]|uniref:YCF48-related protein n=1 Tax=Ideonella margarita TaxID=2984191 RepID=A0ABU9C2A1_9BURK
MRLSLVIATTWAAALVVAQGATAAAAPGAATPAAPVGDALQRPALATAAPERAVLLSAARAGQRLVAVGERGLVALSDDEGRTWRQAPCPVSVSLTMVRFADARNGVAVGHAGTVLTTADAGASWTLRLDGRRVAAAAQQAAATPAAQQEAARLVADGPDKPFLDVLLWDAKRMLAVGAYGLAMHSADGGVTWQPWMDRLPNPKGLHWYVAQRAGDTLLLAGEQGLLATSTDGGRNFRALASPYAGSWFTGDVSASGEWLLAGLRGNVWRSIDGGAQWQALASPVPASITAAVRGSNGQLLLASQAGLVLQVQGQALVPLRAAPLALPSALLPLRDGRLLALGATGVTLVSPAEDKAKAKETGERP